MISRPTTNEELYLARVRIAGLISHYLDRWGATPARFESTDGKTTFRLQFNWRRSIEIKTALGIVRNAIDQAELECSFLLAFDYTHSISDAGLTVEIV